MLTTNLSNFIGKEIIILPNKESLIRICSKYMVNEISYLYSVDILSFLQELELSYSQVICDKQSFKVTDGYIYKIDFITNESDEIYTTSISDSLYNKIIEKIYLSDISENFVIRVKISEKIECTDIVLLNSLIKSDVEYYENNLYNELLPIIEQCAFIEGNSAKLNTKIRSIILNNIISKN